MANTQKYLNHLLQSTGITPACSEEERAAAETIAHVFSNHGFEPEIQEFSANSSPRLISALLGIAIFLGSVFMGIGGVLGLVGLVLAVAAAVLFVLERTGRIRFPQIGAGGLSQNVIAYHKASGPLASPRNRPVVVVAHYDSPRADILSKMPYASYRSLLVKLLPVSMVAPAVIAVVRLFPLPAAAQVVLWLVAIVVSLVALANAVAILLNRFVLPYTSGAVCNKSSVAAMLGVMDAVSPHRGHEEFPDDMPFEEYLSMQRGMFETSSFAPAAGEAEQEETEAGFEPEQDAPALVEPVTDEVAEPELPRMIEEGSEDARTEVASVLSAADPLSATSTMQIPASVLAEALGSATAEVEQSDASDDVDEHDEALVAAATGADTCAVEAEQAPAAPAVPVNAAGCIRYGADTLRSLNMLDANCVIEYEQTDENEIVAGEPLPAEPASEDEAPVADAPEIVDYDDESAFEAPVSDEYAAVDDEAIATSDQPSFDDETGFEDEPEAVAADYDELYENESFDEQPDDTAYDDEAFDEMQGEEAPETFVYADEPNEPEDEEELLEDELGFEDIIPAIYEQLDDDGAVIASENAAQVDDDADEAYENEPVDELLLDDEDVSPENATDDAVEPENEETVVDEALAEGDEVESEFGAEDVTEEDDAPVASLDETEDAADTGEQLVLDVDTAQEETSAAPIVAGGETQAFDMSSVMQHTQPVPAPKPTMDTVDALMAEINTPAPRPKRTITIPDVSPAATASVPRTIDQAVAASRGANRASLLDLPDPSAGAADPFVSADASEASGAAAPRFTVVDTEKVQPQAPSPAAEPLSTISAATPEKPKRKRGLGGLFGRKKKQESSMSDWLGVEDDFDAKRSGRDIGSWDNFDDDSWKGGAAGDESLTEEELREAVTSLGDDELLGHDIWFVATGASENGNAGMHAFLNEHRDKLRGVFLINLECVGSGRLAMVATEGEKRVLKGDKRIMGLVSRVSSDFHHEVGAVEMPGIDTDAHAAMEMSLRGLTIAGVDGASYALSHSEEDLPINVDTENIALAADIVTEVIRRS